MKSVEIIPGGDAPVELLHFAAGLATALAREGVSTAVARTPRLDLAFDDSIARLPTETLRDESTVMVRSAGHPAVMLESQPGAIVRAWRPGEAADLSMPLALHPATIASPRRDRSGAPRILVYGDEGGERRLRMTVRTLEELRARRISFVAIVVGRAPKPLAAMPGEMHEQLTASEWMRLIQGASCVLETTDAQERPTPAVAAAIAAGRPVVVFRTSADVGISQAVRLAEAWSADAFVDAIRATVDERVEPSSEPFDRAMSRVREVLDGE